MTSADRIMSFPDMTTSTTPLWDHPRTAAAARILVDVAAAHQLAADDALTGTGLSTSDLFDPKREIEARQELAIARNLIQRLGDRPGLGVEAGRRYTVGALGLWGFTLVTSPTVRDLAKLGTRYSALSFAFIRPLYHEDADGARVVYDDTEIPHDVRDFFVERELAKLLVLAPATFGDRPGFHIETRFTGPRAAALATVSPVRVLPDQPADALVFTAALLNEPMPQADPVTVEALKTQCIDLLERRNRRRGIAAEVRASILARLNDPPGIDEVAHRLHVEERTLRRKLSAEGTSFRELTDEVRSTMAVELLDGGQLTIQEVATRLGYHDAAAFSRAFKRWTGHRPGAFRRPGLLPTV
ncbi:AraC family transcriptional regulator ligand-binding domain-containing protein [Nocardia sp. NPDC057663]|uniref:AraC family transcriptional regulator n=1 Tax=Nocardia sp. NPDC057663 TaxID=3346201 RepID=UPI00366C029E